LNERILDSESSYETTSENDEDDDDVRNN